MRRLLALGALALGTITCGGAEEDEESARALCDGSDEVRLTFVVDGGMVDAWHPMTGAYGHQFLAIDGRCRYWAGKSFMHGIRTGALSPARGAAIAREMHHARFARFAAAQPSCSPPADGSTLSISAGAEVASCACDCEEGGPRERRAAFGAVRRLHEELFAAGAVFDGPLRVASVQLQGKAGARTAAWPLPWSPAEIAVEEGQRSGSWTRDTGRLVTGAEELSALRTLRAAALAAGMHFGVDVGAADAGPYRVLPRDEAPPSVAAALAPSRR